MAWVRAAWNGAAHRTGARRFLRDRRGAVAIEFGMLILPFSVLIFSTLESCIEIGGQELLASATEDVGRLMRTGQIRPADVNDLKLRQMICDRINILAPSTCMDDVVVDLRSYGTFAEAAAQRIEIVSGTLNTAGFGSTLGGPSSKNMLRTFYKWPVMASFLGASGGTTLNDGRMLLFAGVAWQNEPFDG